jgi:hypothetical protein
MEVSDQLTAPATSPAVKEPLILFGYEAGCASELVLMLWGKEKCFAPARNLSLVIHPVAWRYTD